MLQTLSNIYTLQLPPWLDYAAAVYVNLQTQASRLSIAVLPTSSLLRANVFVFTHSASAYPECMRSDVTPHPHKEPDTAHIISQCDTNNIIYPSFCCIPCALIRYVLLCHHKRADETEKLESRGKWRRNRECWTVRCHTLHTAACTKRSKQTEKRWSCFIMSKCHF